MFPVRVLLRAAMLVLLGRAGALAYDDPHELIEFKARAGSMTAATISPDGKYVLTGEDDGLVTLWNVATGAMVHDYKAGHNRSVFACALLPDGRRAVTCGDDNLVITWDLATGKSLREMSTGGAIPYVMSCSPDGRLAAVGCSDGGIGVWNVESGRRVAALPHAASICGVQFSPDGRLLAAGYADGQTILWNASTWAPKLTLPGEDGASVGALAFSQDGRLLVTGNQDGETMVFQVADGARVARFTDPSAPSPSPPQSPVFAGFKTTPDDHGAVAFVCVGGAFTFVAGQNLVPKMWETKTGTVAASLPWLVDARCYIARYGYPFATAAVTARRDLLVTMKDNLAQVWRITFGPGS